MMTLHATSTQEEQDRILATFQAGHAMCKAALFTLLYAIATFLLAIVHIFSAIINFAIGALTCLYGVLCMVRLLLVLLQELTKTPLATIGGSDR